MTAGQQCVAKWRVQQCVPPRRRRVAAIGPNPLTLRPTTTSLVADATGRAPFSSGFASNNGQLATINILRVEFSFAAPRRSLSTPWPTVEHSNIVPWLRVTVYEGNRWPGILCSQYLRSLIDITIVYVPTPGSPLSLKWPAFFSNIIQNLALDIIRRRRTSIRNRIVTRVTSSYSLSRTMAVRRERGDGLPDRFLHIQYESTKGVEVLSGFDQMNLREDLIRGIYAYGKSRLTPPPLPDVY